DADIAAQVVRDPWHGAEIALEVGGHVRLDVENLRSTGHLEYDDGRRQRHPEVSTGPDGGGNRRRKRDLVLPLADSPHVKTPELRPESVPQRFEGNRGFYRPSLVESPHLEVPHGVEVEIDLPFVGDLPVN